MGPVAYQPSAIGQTAMRHKKTDPPPRTPFGRRLTKWMLNNEVSSIDLAEIAEYSPTQIGNFMRGLTPPSYKLIDRMVRHYHLEDADEWWEAAGFNVETKEPVDERHDIAVRAATEALRMAGILPGRLPDDYDGEKYLAQRLRELTAHYGGAFALRYMNDVTSGTPKELIDEYLSEAERVWRKRQKKELPPALFSE